MSHVRAILCAVTFAAATAGFLVSHAHAEKTAAKPDISKALAQPVELDFVETDLSDVFDFIGKAYEIPVALDLRALDNWAITPDTPVTFSVKGVSLRSALRLMLRQLGLTYTVRDKLLQITTPEVAEERLTTVVYPVADIVPSAEDRSEFTDDVETLAELIPVFIEPTSWSKFGGPGSISGAELNAVRALVVAQTDDIHQQLTSVLAAIRHAGQLAAAGKTTERILLYDDLFGENKVVEAIYAALDEDVDFNFVETRLYEVFEFISKAHSIQCHLDQRALDDMNIPVDTPMTRCIKGISLRTALGLMLDDLDLTCIVRNEVLIITTPEEADSVLLVGLYQVGDLVPRRDQDDEIWDDYDSLIDIITTGVEAESWDAVGGPGSIVAGQIAGAKLLMVSQTEAVHRKIAKLLSDLRAVASESSSSAQPPRKRGAKTPKSPPRSTQGGGFF